MDLTLQRIEPFRIASCEFLDAPLLDYSIWIITHSRIKTTSRF